MQAELLRVAAEYTFLTWTRMRSTTAYPTMWIRLRYTAHCSRAISKRRSLEK